MKKIVVFVLVVCLMLSVLPNAWALEEPEGPGEIIDEYVNASSADVSVKGTKASTMIRATCEGKTGTTGISATVYLQRKNGSSWVPATINGASSISFTGTSSVDRTFNTSVTAGTYRAKAVYKVTCNGSTETITVYSSSVTFS